MILELKMETIDAVFIKSIWSSKDIRWEFVDSLGASGGILTMWDKSKLRWWSMVISFMGQFLSQISFDPSFPIFSDGQSYL